MMKYLNEIKIILNLFGIKILLLLSNGFSPKSFNNYKKKKNLFTLLRKFMNLSNKLGLNDVLQDLKGFFFYFFLILNKHSQEKEC